MENIARSVGRRHARLSFLILIVVLASILAACGGDSIGSPDVPSFGTVILEFRDLLGNLIIQDTEILFQGNTYTTSHGLFELKELRAGTYELTVSTVGFKRADIKFVIQGGKVTHAVDLPWTDRVTLAMYETIVARQDAVLIRDLDTVLELYTDDAVIEEVFETVDPPVHYVASGKQELADWYTDWFDNFEEETVELTDTRIQILADEETHVHLRLTWLTVDEVWTEEILLVNEEARWKFHLVKVRVQLL